MLRRVFSVLHAATSERFPLDYTEDIKKAFCSLNDNLTTPPVLDLLNFDPSTSCRDWRVFYVLACRSISKEERWKSSRGANCQRNHDERQKPLLCWRKWNFGCDVCLFKTSEYICCPVQHLPLPRTIKAFVIRLKRKMSKEGWQTALIFWLTVISATSTDQVNKMSGLTPFRYRQWCLRWREIRRRRFRQSRRFFRCHFWPRALFIPITTYSSSESTGYPDNETRRMTRRNSQRLAV